MSRPSTNAGLNFRLPVSGIALPQPFNAWDSRKAQGGTSTPLSETKGRRLRGEDCNGSCDQVKDLYIFLIFGPPGKPLYRLATAHGALYRMLSQGADETEEMGLL